MILDLFKKEKSIDKTSLQGELPKNLIVKKKRVIFIIRLVYTLISVVDILQYLMLSQVTLI